MKAVFLGTSEFALPFLEALNRSEIQLQCVVTRPPRPAGRGKRLRQPPVYRAASELGLPVHQPAKLKTAFIEMLRSLDSDIMVTAAYGAWLPPALLNSARLGVMNVHPSLLPLYRGAAPVARAIMDGAERTGVTFMLTDEGWDTGPVIDSFPEPIRSDDTTGTLTERLAEKAAERIAQVMEEYRRGVLQPVPQMGRSCYAEKISKKETWIDWRRPAEEIERLVRALQPSPGARTRLNGKMIKVVRASICSQDMPAGGIVAVDDGLTVGCGNDASLKIRELQPASKKVMKAQDFIRGARLDPGDSFELP
ncbi:MAG: methionyl-tRNA formyltransferase [Candidatus Aegiribacteria sp.]|nr:methionyl-tRNA formyltransferase [Candidatus Aegiribacteria sp.]MBD3294766.1 methionyl-tRNA formyltransferase [Candidatus Fermentibacteria bacterium]